MKWIKGLIFFILAIILLFLLMFKPIDRTALDERPFYHSMTKKLDTLHAIHFNDSSELKTSWIRINITPTKSMPMAGYKPRDSFSGVHDSIYCRILHIQKGSDHIYLISADLLLFPPVIRDHLQEKIRDPQHTFLYFSATHTHSAPGGWNNSTGGELTMGKYSPEWVKNTSDKLTQAIRELSGNSKTTSLSYYNAEAPYVENRLIKGAPVDDVIRGIKLIRSVSDSAILSTYSGHATLVDSKSRELSADYPGALNKKLESAGYGFSEFMAGMVGSHRIANVPGEGFDRIDKTATLLYEKVNDPTLEESVTDSNLTFLTYEVPLGPSQLRIMDTWAVRNWLFGQLFEPLQAHITAFKLGDILFISMPCDFSGELFVNEHITEWMKANYPDEKIIITSFNGDYIGYITEDQHYDESRNEEVRTMNWVGPYYGEYFTELVKRTIDIMNED